MYYNVEEIIFILYYTRTCSRTRRVEAPREPLVSPPLSLYISLSLYIYIYICICTHVCCIYVYIYIYIHTIS